MSAAADPRSQMLSEMAQCAYRIGMAFGREAERAGDLKAKIAFAELFERCFFAVRVSTALELRLRREQPREAREPTSDREGLIERPDPPEPEDLGREDRDLKFTERDRDREAERASFPILIRALDGVAADAAALPGPAPTALVTLRELLAKVKSDPPPASVLAKPSGNLRAKLAGGATALALAPRPPPASSGPLTRRATGPPHA